MPKHTTIQSKKKKTDRNQSQAFEFPNKQLKQLIHNAKSAQKEYLKKKTGRHQSSEKINKKVKGGQRAFGHGGDRVLRRAKRDQKRRLSLGWNHQWGGGGGREGGSYAQRERRKLVGNELNYYTSPSHLEFIFKKYNRSRYSNKKFIYTITIYFLTFR